MSYHLLSAKSSLSSSLRDLYDSICGEISGRRKQPQETLSDIEKSTALAIAMSLSMGFVDVIMKIPKQLHCYHRSNNKTITLAGTIRESLDHGRGVVVMEGRLEGYKSPLVVKWYQGDTFDIRHEIAMYNAIGSLDHTILPWFSGSYTVWTDPVLVMELLTILDDTDHENDVGISVLNKLKLIHRVCIHSDIKPSNIVKRADTGNYYLIDYGQSTTLDEVEEGGQGRTRLHRRHVHTKKYNRLGYKHRTSIKTDLLELLYSLRQIQITRTNDNKKDPRANFKGSLHSFHSVLEGTGEYPGEEIYDKLISTLS